MLPRCTLAAKHCAVGSRESIHTEKDNIPREVLPATSTTRQKYMYRSGRFVWFNTTVDVSDAVNTSLEVFATTTDYPCKSVCNRCVIKVFGGVFVLSLCLFLVFCWCKGRLS